MLSNEGEQRVEQPASVLGTAASYPRYFFLPT